MHRDIQNQTCSYTRHTTHIELPHNSAAPNLRTQQTCSRAVHTKKV